jgi:hypothetical protein
VGDVMVARHSIIVGGRDVMCEHEIAMNTLGLRSSLTDLVP